VLSDNVAKIPSYGAIASSPFYFGDRPVAAKTGTTNDYRDVWVVGYTPSVVIGMWGGNNNNTPIDKKVAGLVLAPIWHKAMTSCYSNINC
jgi:membrane peptidoglycan carboxypeptidase